MNLLGTMIGLPDHGAIEFPASIKNSVVVQSSKEACLVKFGNVVVMIVFVVIFYMTFILDLAYL